MSGGCVTGKVGYISRKRARQEKRRQSRNRLSVYLCERCGMWHLGNLPSHIRRGKIGRNGQ